MKEADNMTDKQLDFILTQFEIIVAKSKTTEEIKEAIEKLRATLKASAK